MEPSKYTVVTSDDFGKFEDRVNQLIGDGWTLQGGVSAVALPDTEAGLIHVQWSQALVLPLRPLAAEKEETAEEPLPLDIESVPALETFPQREKPHPGGGAGISL